MDLSRHAHHPARIPAAAPFMTIPAISMDARIKKLAAAGGTIQINSYNTYLTRRPRDPEPTRPARAVRKLENPVRHDSGTGDRSRA